MMTRMSFKVWLVAGVGLAAGCATADSGIHAGDPQQVQGALGRSHAVATRPVNAEGRPLAFVVTATVGERRGNIVAVDLASASVLWRQPADVSGRLAVGRTVLVYTQNDGSKAGILVARDPLSGILRWSKKSDPTHVLVGYATEGEEVFQVTVTRSTERARETIVTAYEANHGTERWQRHFPGDAGGPAAWGGLLAVPRQSQYVTLMNGATGEVLSEILSRQEAATFVRGLPEGLFFGSRGIYRAAAETASGERPEGMYFQAKLPPFVHPLYHWDMYRAEQGDYSALDRNRVLWRIAPVGGKGGFADGMVVVHNFRFFFAFAADTGQLRWAYAHPRTDVMASDNTGKAILFVSAEGEIGALDLHSGRPQMLMHLSERGSAPVVVRGATFDAEGYVPPDATGPAPRLAEALASLVWEPDLRFTDVKLFAIDQMSHLPDADVTASLLKALEGGSALPPEVAERAVEALVARRDHAAVDQYIAALEVRPDYAEGRKPRRLDVYARAVAGLNAKQALPALVEHLRLPDTDPVMVRDIADAVLAMKGGEVVDAFADYLLEYRADPSLAGKPGSLEAAAEVLLRLGGPKERATLLFVAQDPRTLAVLRSYLERGLATPPVGAE